MIAGGIRRWSASPVTDWVLAACAIGVWRLARHLDAIPATQHVDMVAIYQAEAGVAAVVIGLFILPASFLFSLSPGRRLNIVAASKLPDLRRAVVSTGAAATAGLASSFLGLAFDPTAAGVVFRSLCLGTVVLLLLSIVRVLHTVNLILRMHHDDQQPTVGDDVEAHHLDFEEALRVHEGVDAAVGPAPERQQ